MLERKRKKEILKLRSFVHEVKMALKVTKYCTPKNDYLVVEHLHFLNWIKNCAKIGIASKILSKENKALLKRCYCLSRVERY